MHPRMLPMFSARRPAMLETWRADVGGVSVLLVDDESFVGDAIASFLRARGAHVVVAGSAVSALAALERHSIDVLVSDIQMPGHDGFWLIREVRSRPNLRSISAIRVHVSR